MTSTVLELREVESPILSAKAAKNHTAPIARLEDNKLATDFGLSILHKRITEIDGIVKGYNQKNMPATTAWEQIVAVINRS